MKNLFTTFAAGSALTLALVAMPFNSAFAQDDHHDNGARVQQTQHPDYSHNSYYTLGNREGYQDYQKKAQRKEHNHKYRTDDDRAAHDYGYQKGWQGQRGYKPDSDRH